MEHKPFFNLGRSSTNLIIIFSSIVLALIALGILLSMKGDLEDSTRGDYFDSKITSSSPISELETKEYTITHEGKFYEYNGPCQSIYPNTPVFTDTSGLVLIGNIENKSNSSGILLHNYISGSEKFDDVSWEIGNLITECLRNFNIFRTLEISVDLDINLPHRSILAFPDDISNQLNETDFLLVTFVYDNGYLIEISSKVTANNLFTYDDLEECRYLETADGISSDVIEFTCWIQKANNLESVHVKAKTIIENSLLRYKFKQTS